MADFPYEKLRVIDEARHILPALQRDGVALGSRKDIETVLKSLSHPRATLVARIVHAMNESADNFYDQLSREHETEYRQCKVIVDEMKAAGGIATREDALDWLKQHHAEAKMPRRLQYTDHFFGTFAKDRPAGTEPPIAIGKKDEIAKVMNAMRGKYSKSELSKLSIVEIQQAAKQLGFTVSRTSATYMSRELRDPVSEIWEYLTISPGRADSAVIEELSKVFKVSKGKAYSMALRAFVCLTMRNQIPLPEILEAAHSVTESEMFLCSDFLKQIDLSRI